MAKQLNSSKEWRLLAERDMSIAEHLSVKMIPIPTEVVTFFCQQTVEKYLKGALVILGEDPPWIHDLPELCKLSEKYRPSFASISPLCSIITHYAVQPRYDFGLSISEEDMCLVLAHTKTIKEFLQNELPDLFQETDKKPS
jgi:HEPN domain-containing protein